MPADTDPGLFEIIHTTRSMRRLKSDPVPEELIQKILEAGVCAPSGGNMQRWRFLVVTDAKVKETVASYYKRAWDEYVGPTYRSGAPAPGADPQRFARMLDAAQYLADHLHEAPVWIIACLEGVGVHGVPTYWSGSSRYDWEYELIDTGVFNDDRYFDVFVEYAKAAPTDILVQVSVANRGPEAARVHVLPTLWFRNTWTWWPEQPKPSLRRMPGASTVTIETSHAEHGGFLLHCDGNPDLLFTENDTNNERIFGSPNASPYVKDGNAAGARCRRRSVPSGAARWRPA